MTMGICLRVFFGCEDLFLEGDRDGRNLYYSNDIGELSPMSPCYRLEKKAAEIMLRPFAVGFCQS